MNPIFITVNCTDDSGDCATTINANNISSIRRLDYNGRIQTMILMIGGERFGVVETPEEVKNLTAQEAMQVH